MSAMHPTFEKRDWFDEVERRLDAEYGPRILHPNHEPLTSLVATILSQNTSDVNTARSLASLRDRYPAWEDLVDADTGEIANAIKSGGLSNIKAPRIQAVISDIIEETGGTDIRFLVEKPVDQAMKWLTDRHGVGPKTAACVLLFALGMPAMPVDTHVGRVMTRLGAVPDKSSTATKQQLLEDYLDHDPDRIYAVHVETIEHGRRICTARRPKCETCMLGDICEYAQTNA